MENPEALLDFLTIRSWKERYHTDSETDESIKTLLTNNEEDLESFVRDFTIDDSISDCFAEDLDDKNSTVFKASDPPDLDFMYSRTFHSPGTTPRNFHNPAGSSHPQRFLTFDERRNTFPAFQKTKDSQPCEITIPSQDTLCFPVDQLNQSSHTVRRGQNNPGTLEICSTLQPSQNLDNKRDSETCFIPAVPFSSKITETGTKLDKVSNLCKQSKFGLKQVWSNTLKKCITKTDSIQNDDNDDSLFVNVKRFKTENNHVGPSNIPPALTSEHIQDFDDLCPVKVCTQLQGKSEPHLSNSKACIIDNSDQKVFNRPSELFLHSKSAEVISDHLPNAAPQDTRAKQTVSSEHAQQNITPIHCSDLRRNELEKNPHKLSYLTKSDNVAEVSNNIGSGITDNGETIIKNKTMDGTSISPDMKIGLLDKINQALFQRTLVTLLKQSRCTSLLADILETLVNGKVLETLCAAVDQLKQLLYISNLPQDVSRLLKLIHKNLENTFSQLSHLKATVEKLNIEMPLTLMPSDEQNRDHEFQSRTLLADTYNIIKKHPPDLNDKIQDLISFHLKSKLLTLTSGQVSQLESFTPVTLETLNPHNQPISKEHNFRMVLNSKENYSHHNTSNFKGESLQSSSQDAQCRVVEDKPLAIQNRNIQLHQNSEIRYPCLNVSDYSSEKMTPHESGHLSAPEHLHYKSARSHDCKCHQSSRHGHKCQEKRPDHCKHRHRDTRRCRRKKRSVSDTRHTRRRHTISSFTTSSAYTPSTTISAQSTDRHRRRRGSHTFRSSSSSKSSRLRSNDYDDYWSDNESDDDDDDDESFAPLVRLNLDNEDLPDEALRIDRLHRHLESVQKLHQNSEDIIETIITGTGEKLVPHDRFASGTSYTRTLPLGHKESSDSWLVADQAEHSNSSTKAKSEGLKSSKLKVFKPRGLSAAQLFNHEKALLKNMRELTDSEFEETFERRHDINVKRRQQMDSEIPWDQLSFSESESDDQIVK
ncbi:uncharacterized protein LOC106051621 [Biomphalaria glabrata]|uniref:Uncharacterized protein LOC106051621 n=1 Tax=Biomphalaria glabrata TaxID=6526 RepID=A0A9W2ZEK5_BIOGL|nr:uncharacterized protein LOC106051621 [Biomphalaria glabrata]XP_055873448.1 uncharacterized protein LOC106051621 [Biomphalaria glabrata]XP_055873449.1 uncharacterized protein LOC106051621 [Biomphalaria glabrata]